tara:strand:+ start:372 stop:1793 length:1422 start_codon:yes stop_codon:yes gene_type:complete
MKKISKLFTVCCFVVSISAHTQEKSDCETNFNEALSYFRITNYSKKDSIKAIEILKPCLEKGDDKTQLLMGRLYNAKADEENYEKAFELFKKSAKQGNDLAMADLGVLYKYGRGCNLNFNKARRWFEKGAELGNDKASYSLGYLYLKGFGSIDQDYAKAIKWFKKSNHPMAKYWLGTCYYYGYGVDKNLQKANDLLGTNFDVIVNSPTNNDESSNTTANELVTDDLGMLSKKDESKNINITGKWKGTLLKYDWSGNYIEQKQEVNIDFEIDSTDQSLKYLISLENQDVSGSIIQQDNIIYFESAIVKLPHTTFSEQIPNELYYEFLSSDLGLKDFNESTYLIGNLESYIPSFNEAGAPLKLVLKKTETFANTDEELSDAVLQALAEQKESFIKLYPNPFESDLIISYTLEKNSFVEIRVSDVNGTKNTLVAKGKEQEAGKHSYFFEGNNLDKGLYIVTVTVDNKKKTKIIVKK